MTQKDLLLRWLNDAYGMESGIVHVLENHVKDAKDYSQLQNKIQDHLEKTKCHEGMVKDCIERLGGSVSPIKNVLGDIMGAAHSVSTGPADDQLVKNGLSDFATENFEIACYRSLIAAARTCGDPETVRACESILRDEEDMARYLEQNLSHLTVDVFAKLTAGERRAA